MAEMQLFAKKMAGFVSLQALVLMGFLTPYVLNYKQIVQDGFMAATVDKHRLLQEQKTPRLIFVGGSAFAYGNDSGKIGQQLNYHPVNMGLHAGVGAEFMLNEIETGLKPGDVVVISFEYENFIDYPAPPGANNVFDIVEARWQNAQYLSAPYVPALLDKGFIFAGSVLRRSVGSLTGQLDERKPYYRRTSFNEYGDAVVHRQFPPQTDKVANDRQTFDFEPGTVQQLIQTMNEFHQQVEARGVRVFFAYPPLVKHALEKSRPEIAQLQAQLEEELEFPILDTPDDVAYPVEDYFDTRYHLGKTGVEKRSQHLADRLATYLK
jgi:hypothetical protein